MAITTILVCGIGTVFKVEGLSILGAMSAITPVISPLKRARPVPYYIVSNQQQHQVYEINSQTRSRVPGPHKRNLPYWVTFSWPSLLGYPRSASLARFVVSKALCTQNHEPNLFDDRLPFQPEFISICKDIEMKTCIWKLPCNGD